tara:strand:+ start:316 stop:690 length:375 start_codon:yes stop_codon:yes gene_type:complete
MRIKQNKKERFTEPSRTVGTWLTYRTDGHTCDDRAQTDIYCKDVDTGKLVDEENCWGECGPMEWLYEAIMDLIDSGLRMATGDLNIDVEKIWEWFLKILAIFFVCVFFGLLYKFYGLVSTVTGE